MEVHRSKGATRRASTELAARVQTREAFKVFAIGCECGRVFEERFPQLVALDLADRRDFRDMMGAGSGCVCAGTEEDLNVMSAVVSPKALGKVIGWCSYTSKFALLVDW